MDRQISDPIRLISDKIFFCKDKENKNIRISADFAAAFDSISHNLSILELRKIIFVFRIIW